MARRALTFSATPQPHLAPRPAPRRSLQPAPGLAPGARRRPMPSRAEPSRATPGSEPEPPLAVTWRAEVGVRPRLACPAVLPRRSCRKPIHSGCPVLLSFPLRVASLPTPTPAGAGWRSGKEPPLTSDSRSIPSPAATGVGVSIVVSARVNRPIGGRGKGNWGEGEPLENEPGECYLVTLGSHPRLRQNSDNTRAIEGDETKATTARAKRAYVKENWWICCVA